MAREEMSTDKNPGLPKHENLRSMREKYSPANEVTPEVLDDLRRGNHEAYRMIYLQFVNPLTEFIARLTRSRSTAEDLTQEILFEVWEKRATINIRSSVKGYLYTIARHAVADHFRKLRRNDIFDDSSNYPDRAEGSFSPDEDMVVRETEMLVRLVTSTMPRQRRIIFDMSNTEGLTNSEIAERLGISKTAVEKQISDARREVRDVLRLFFFLFVSLC
jgi:RNA polymerase sigma-70 factor (ECF subfamily)